MPVMSAFGGGERPSISPIGNLAGFWMIDAHKAQRSANATSIAMLSMLSVFRMVASSNWDS